MKPLTNKSIVQLVKRLLITLLIILAITFRTSLTDMVKPEKPVSKTVEIALYTSADYSQDIYKNSSAKVEVTISKYRNKKFQVVYNATMEAADLHNIPTEKNAFVKAIEVKNFYEKKEILVATYTVSYRSNGNVIKYDKHILIPETNGKRELTVTI